jgi:hypothetical protein
MADNQIEIDVVLNSEDAVEGFETLGETSSAIAERFSKDNSKLGEGLGQLTGNVTAVVGSVKGLGAVFATTGTAGKTAWLSMLGPIAAVVAAGYALYETYLLISGAAEEAERSEEAMTAAAGDLQSKLEALAEKGIIPTAKELNAFTIATIEAQYAKERLQQAMEKGVTPAVDKYHKALTALTKLQKKSRDGTERTLAQNQELGRSIMRHQQALTKQREALRAQFAEYKEEQDISLRMIAQAAKSEQEYEERSNEARLARIKENKTKEDSLLLMSAQSSASEQVAKVYEVEQKKLRALFDLELERNKDKSEYLAKLDADLQKSLESIPQEVLITAAANKAIADVKEEGRKKEAAEQAKAQAAATARAAKYRAIRKAKEVKLQNELRAIRALQLERFAIDGKSELEILKLRYEDETKLAKKNTNLKTIALMRYENSKTRIIKEKEQEGIQNQLEANQARLDQEAALADQRQSFIESTMAFDAQRIEDQTTRELALLDIRYQKEFGLAEYTQEQITELQRRQALERQDILDQSLNASIEKMKGMAEDLAKTSTSAIYQSLVDAGQFDLQFEELKYSLEENVGRAREEMINAQASNDIQLVRQKEEEITNITKDYETQRQQIRAQQSQAMPLMFGQILKGLGQEAAVESMMETAKGISTLFTAPVLAGNHFAAAGVFAGAAALAGAAGAGLTNSANTAISRAGRGGGGGGALSPLGSPQTAPSPQREEAETSSMVFNINFGGAVIYDTQRAAEQAMADRITTLQNTRRRGAPRRSF